MTKCDMLEHLGGTEPCTAKCSVHHEGPHSSSNEHDTPTTEQALTIDRTCSISLERVVQLCMYHNVVTAHTQTRGQNVAYV